MSDEVKWQLAEVTSALLDKPVSVVAAKNIPSVSDANRLQNFSIYLPHTSETSRLVGTIANTIPFLDSKSLLPRCHVHVHGGVWRDPLLSSLTIEADVARTFSTANAPIDTVISINYTLSPFPTHPSLPYDPVTAQQRNPGREAKHPRHVHDVLSAFQRLRSFGLSDGYILTGHSCGACIAFQSVLQPPEHWALDLPAPPRPAALLGMNGLYELPALVHGLGPSHQYLDGVYENLISIAFGDDQSKWPAASPALFDTAALSKQVTSKKAPQFVMVDQSTEDELVLLNQADRMQAKLEEVPEIKVVRGKRCVGPHAAPWKTGSII